MIALQRLNNDTFILNADHIESIESTPDSVISMTTGKKIVVRNSVEDIIRKVIKYKQLCNQTVAVVAREKPDSDMQIIS